MYKSLINFCKEKNCKLVTTEEEYNKKKERPVQIDIISSCGHQSNNVYVHVFKSRDTGVICKDCHLETSKNFNKNNNKFSTLNIEHDANTIIRNNCNNLIIEKTNDGCKIDFLIKPKDKELYLPFQLKSTKSKYNGSYSFGICGKEYINMLIILVAVEDKKIWILDNNLINNKKKLSIGSQKSKYSCYEINNENLEKKIIEYYIEYDSYLIDKKFANIPISDNQKKEYEYKLLRESKLNFLNFEEPEKNQQCYDFIINNFRIQEKIASKRKDRNSYTCSIFKSNGTINGKRNFKCYENGDNDFYWIHIPDKIRFLFIPENIMIERQIVNSIDEKKKNICVPKIIKKDNWLYDYSFDYNNFDKEKFNNLLITRKLHNEVEQLGNLLTTISRGTEERSGAGSLDLRSASRGRST